MEPSTAVDMNPNEIIIVNCVVAFLIGVYFIISISVLLPITAETLNKVAHVGCYQPLILIS